MLSSTKIFLLRQSLKYEAGPTQCVVVDRTTFYRMRAEEKSNRYRDSFLERVSPVRFAVEQRKAERELFRKCYDSAIMEKYNVGPDWRDNRWFVEQMRPSLF